MCFCKFSKNFLKDEQKYNLLSVSSINFVLKTVFLAKNFIIKIPNFLDYIIYLSYLFFLHQTNKHFVTHSLIKKLKIYSNLNTNINLFLFTLSYDI